MRKFAIVILALVSAQLGAEEKSWIDSDSKVIVVADEHHGQAFYRDFTGAILPTLKAKFGFDCLLVEWIGDLEDSIQEYMRDEKSYADSMQAKRAEIFQTKNIGTYNMLPQSLAEAAKKIKVSIHAIDAPLDSQLFKKADAVKGEILSYDTQTHDEDVAAKKAPHQVIEKWERIMLEQRNEFFTKRILDLIDSGQCKKAVFIVGVDHTLNMPDGIQVKTVQDFLAMEKLNTTVIRPKQ